MKTRNGVIGIIYRDGGREHEFLVLRRKQGWQGWEFPKGGMEEGEEEEKALLRELGEETGLRSFRSIAKVPYVVSYEYPEAPGNKYSGTVQSVYLLRFQRGAVRLSGEHDDYRWVKLGEALQFLTYDNQKRALERALDILANIK